MDRHEDRPINNHLTLSDALSSSLGAREDNTTTSTASRYADINNGNVAGNVLVISALVETRRLMTPSSFQSWISFAGNTRVVQLND